MKFRHIASLPFLFLTLFILTATVFPVTAAAQKKQRTATPDAAATTKRYVPDVQRDSLPNGLRIVFARVNDLPLAEINIIVDAGIALEKDNERSVSWALTQMLLSGSKDRTGDMVTNFLLELGSSVVPYVHYDYAQLYGRSLAKNFSGTLSVMADAVSAPALPEQALLALQKNSSTRLQRIVSSGERATVTAVQSVCGEGHVMSRYLQPFPEEVSGLRVEQLRAFHATWYQPRRTTVIVTGNLDYAFVRTALVEAFGKWSNTENGPSLRATISTPSITSGTDKPVLLLPDSETPKGLAYFRLGVQTPLRGDDRFAATILLNSIVSDGPQSRLRRKFWGERVISPNFSAAVAFSRDCSYFMISGSATPALADTVLQFAQDAVLEIARAGVTDDELSAAKSAMLANEALTFASNRNVQSLLKESAVYGIPYERMVAFADRIRSVTAADIQRVAHELFQPGRWSTVTLGDAEKITPVLTASGRTVKIVE